MPQNKQNLLIDYLDNNLSGEELLEAEALVRNDQEMAKEWQYLHLAVDAIQESGLQEQVAGIRKLYEEQRQIKAKPASAIVHNIYRNVLRIAAVLLILIGAAAVYKYTTVNATGMYNEYYTSFELNTTRGVENADAMEQAYRNKNWASVISLSNTLAQKTNKSYFLTGMANLELKKYNGAIEAFGQIIAANIKSGDNYFQDEAEYYLALGYMANNEASKALPLLEKIKSDKHHLYYEKVRGISSIDLNIIKYKAGK